MEFRTANPPLPSSAQRVRLETVQATLETKPSGTAAVWKSNADDAGGQVSPTRTFRARLAHFCRDYEERIDWQGRLFRVLSTACRNQHGRWERAEQPVQMTVAGQLRSGGGSSALGEIGPSRGGVRNLAD